MENIRKRSLKKKNKEHLRPLGKYKIVQGEEKDSGAEYLIK